MDEADYDGQELESTFPAHEHRGSIFMLARIKSESGRNIRCHLRLRHLCFHEIGRRSIILSGEGFQFGHEKPGTLVWGVDCSFGKV